MLAEALYSAETSTIEIAAIIDDRAYLQRLAEQAEFPCVVNVPVSDIPDGVTHSGEDNVYVARWQVDVYAQAYEDAKDLARKIEKLFVPMRRQPIAEFVITSCRRINTQLWKESALDKWRFMIEFEFRYSYLELT